MEELNRNRAHYGYSSFHKDDGKRHALVNGDSYITATDHATIGTKVFLKTENGWSIVVRSTPSALSSPNSMASITVRLSTPNSPRHNLTVRTSLPAPLVPDLPQARNLKRQRRAPSQISNPPTEPSEEPENGVLTRG